MIARSCWIFAAIKCISHWLSRPVSLAQPDRRPVNLQKAASIDPQDRASLPGPEGAAAREARLQGAYGVAMNVARFLVDPGRADPSLHNVALSPGERQAYLKQFLQVCCLVFHSPSGLASQPGAISAAGLLCVVISTAECLICLCLRRHSVRIHMPLLSITARRRSVHCVRRAP